MTTANGRAMFVAAHPDDPDFLAGGTVARLVQEDRELTYVIVTNGNKGSADRSATPEQLTAIREEEQRRAARVLGVGHVQSLGYEGGELEDTRDLRRDVAREIRRWRPDLIITLNPHRTYNNFPGWHRDHRITGRVVLDWEQPRLVIDITDTMDLKLEAIRCHASQVRDFQAFEARMRSRAATIGKGRGYSCAEGFDSIVVPG